MLASLILSLILAGILSFYALVQRQTRALETSEYYQDMSSTEEWCAHVEASLGEETDDILATPVGAQYLDLLDAMSWDHVYVVLSFPIPISNHVRIAA